MTACSGGPAAFVQCSPRQVGIGADEQRNAAALGKGDGINLSEPTWQVDDEASAADLAVLDGGLDAANLASAPQLADVRALAVFVRAGNAGQVSGGAVGRTWGECCELQQLWVDAARCRQGFGSELLRRFEGRALERGCRVFYLTTFSFQAPDFYRRFGYVSATEVRGFPDGIVKHLMLKTVAGNAS